MGKGQLGLLQVKALLLVFLHVETWRHFVNGAPSELSQEEPSEEPTIRFFPPPAAQHEDFEEESNVIPGHQEREKVIQKRSAYGYDYPEEVNDYGGDWDSNSNDPGYESYMQSLHYDPMMAWGRRKRNKEDQYRNLGFQKRTFNTFDYQDPIYFQHFMPMKRVPSGNYMDSVYIPHHFFNSYKRALDDGGSDPADYKQLSKRSPGPIEMGSRGFHEGIFTHHFGDFSPVKRRRKRDVEKDSATENQKTHSEGPLDPALKNRALYPYNGRYLEELSKRRFGMDASGFHGDTFSNGFGSFSTMKRNNNNNPGWDSSVFYDPYSNGMGGFYDVYKRRPEMDAMGFHGDTFHGGFGDFYTMKKRRPEMTSSGFYGDTFSNGFGDFYTMKKRGDNGSGGQRVKRESSINESKRRPEMTSSGFFGDTFSNGFGDFYTMKRGTDKRRPEMTSSGFFGDTFSNGFGDFYTMKKRIHKLNDQLLGEVPVQAARSTVGEGLYQKPNIDPPTSLNKELTPNKER